MHELSLCRAIAETAIEYAQGRTVARVNLRIGHLRQVVPDTLRFCWEVGIDDPVLSDAVLNVSSVPAVARCQDCGASTDLELPILRCGSCDSSEVELVAGEEFLIESIELLADAPPVGSDPAPPMTTAADDPPLASDRR